VDAIDKMKLSVIEDYNKFLLNLFNGYKINYGLLLNKISYIENCGRFTEENFIYSNLINKSI